MTEVTPSATPISPLESRRAEVAQYEANIALFQAILTTHTDVWPDRLLEFKNAQNRHAVIGEVENLDDVELLSKLWAADDARRAIRSEMVELAKAKAILAVLENNA